MGSKNDNSRYMYMYVDISIYHEECISKGTRE